jgi:hypothetical protein
VADSDSLGPRWEGSFVEPVQYPSARALAVAFGGAVFEPGWWPDDMGEVHYEIVHYEIDPFPSELQYHIVSIRNDGTPISAIGYDENPRSHLPQEDWYEPAALKALGGIVAGTPSGFRSALNRDGQTFQLLGYRTEADVVRAVLSLNRVMP